MSEMMFKAWAEQDKRLASLKARAALLGIALYLVDDGLGGDLYMAYQGLWDRSMRTMDEVDAFLQQFEGKR